MKILSFSQRQLHPKFDQSAAAMNADLPAVGECDRFGDGEPQAVMPVFAAAGGVCAVKALKKLRLLLGRYFIACIDHRQPRKSVLCR